MVRLLYTGAVSSIIMYAASVWSGALNRKCNIAKLEKLQRPLCLRVCRSYRTVSSVAAQVLSALPPLWLGLLERADRYRVKATGTLPGLPSDRRLQQAVPFGDLQHPALRMYACAGDSDGCENSCVVCLYTAGSAGSKGVGAAFMVVKDDAIIVTRKFLLSKYCTELQASLLAVWKSLEWLYKWLEGRTNMYGEGVKVFVKLSSAKGMMFGTSFHPLVFRSQCLVYGIHSKFGVKVIFGCQGRARGVCASVVNDAATSACNRKTAPAYDCFDMKYACSRLRMVTYERWNEHYRSSAQASSVKGFFSSVGSALKFVRRCGWSYHLNQALTGHGCFRANLHRFHLIDDPSCMCDRVSPQNVCHLLFDCQSLNEERNEWRRMCANVSVDFSMDGFRKAIDEGVGLNVIGICLKRMVECTMEMNDESD